MSTYQDRARLVLNDLFREGMKFQIDTKAKSPIVKNDEHIDQALSELASIVEELIPAERTWGGYDGEDIVDDKEALGYNQAIYDMRKSLKRVK